MNGANRTKDKIKRIIDLSPTVTDLNYNVAVTYTGSLSSGIRADFKDLNDEKRLKTMEESIANRYKNNTRLESLSFQGLNSLDDSVAYRYKYTVKNEVSEIGSLQAFKINYHDLIATLDKFAAEKRAFPIEYWSYEDADVYETVVNITAPANKKFVDVPASQIIIFKNLK